MNALLKAKYILIEAETELPSLRKIMLGIFYSLVSIAELLEILTSED